MTDLSAHTCGIRYDGAPPEGCPDPGAHRNYAIVPRPGPAGELVRKGALAADRMSRDPDVAVACDVLARLADFGAMAGVAEIARARLRQVQDLGHSADRDDIEHTDGWLMHEAVRLIQNAGRRVAEGISGAEDIEEACREAGALLAAEADRLFRMLTPETVTIVITPEAGS
jgi:hypothetical protein